MCSDFSRPSKAVRKNVEAWQQPRLVQGVEFKAGGAEAAHAVTYHGGRS